MFRCFDPDDVLNQYTSAGPATFSYDGKGNLTSDGTRITDYGDSLLNTLNLS